MIHLETFDFFARDLLDPLFLVFEVLDKPEHPKHQSLLRDLASLPAVEVAIFVEEHHVDFYIERREDKDLARRAYCLVDKLQEAIAAERLEKISSNELRPAPYDTLIFDDVPLDKHQMVALSDISPWFGGFVHQDRCFTLCPATAGSNSSYWSFNALMDVLRGKPREKFKVRLDPFIDLPKDQFNPMQYRMTVHGLPLNWERLLILKAEEFGQWMSDSSHKDFLFTDYSWKPVDNELHFTCEELPTPNAIHSRGSRYFHAIFEMETGLIKHCDGAIRIYDEQEIAYRADFHVRNAEVRKTGKRIKIFQIDTFISKEEFTLLLGSFFVWNDDVQQYIAAGLQ